MKILPVFYYIFYAHFRFVSFYNYIRWSAEDWGRSVFEAGFKDKWDSFEDWKNMDINDCVLNDHEECRISAPINSISLITFVSAGQWYFARLENPHFFLLFFPGISPISAAKLPTASGPTAASPSREPSEWSTSSLPWSASRRGWRTPSESLRTSCRSFSNSRTNTSSGTRPHRVSKKDHSDLEPLDQG